MRRTIILELNPDDEREFFEIVQALGIDGLRGCTIHLAINDAAEAVLAAMPHLGKP